MAINPAHFLDSQTDLKITLGMVSITPTLAAEMLKTSTEHQRAVDRNTVNKYARIMSRGLWVGANGDSIRISSDNTLIDGQHRLAAVIVADTDIEMLVMSGIHEDNIKTIDDGKPRTFSDMLRIDGHASKGAYRVSAFIKYIKRLHMVISDDISGQSSWGKKVSNLELLDMVKKNDCLMESSDQYATLFNISAISRVVGGTCPMLFWYIFGGDINGAAYSVLKTIERGIPENRELDNKSPSHVIYTEIMRMKSRHVSFKNLDYLKLLVWAFSNERNNVGVSSCATSKILNQEIMDSDLAPQIKSRIIKLKK